MKNRIVITYAGGGGSPEQSQRVVFGYQLDENYSQTSARRGKPRSYAQARALAFNAKGEKPAEPVPYLVPSDWTTKNPYCHSELVSESVPRYEQVSNIGQTLKLSWICSTLAEIRLRSFAPTGSICSLAGFHFAQPYANPQVQGDKSVQCDGKNESSSRGANEVSDAVIQATERHLRLVGHDFLTPKQLGSRLDRRWIATPAKPARNDRGWFVHAAFTMAEILLSLTIIGVVAAITLPSLTGNINERTWNTQRKALYARFSQALPLMDALNGYGTLVEDGTGSVTEDTVAETFITAGLAKVIKINNICDNEHLEDCGVASKITNLAGTQIDLPATTGELNSLMVGTHSTSVETFSLPDTKAAAFETQNGESILVYYNNRCLGSLAESPLGDGGIFMSPKICANFIYDLNGNKGPNTVGKDIGFMTAMYPYDAVLAAPYPAPQKLGASYLSEKVSL